MQLMQSRTQTRWRDALKQTQLLQQSVPATAPAHAAHAADAVDGTAALSTEEQMDQSAVDATAALSTEEQTDQIRQHELFFKLQQQIDLEQLRNHDDLQREMLQSVVSELGQQQQQHQVLLQQINP